MATRTFLLLLCISGFSYAAQSQTFQAAGSPSNPKVEVAWNRYYTYDGVTDICKRLAQAHPGLVKIGSMGKSYQGKEMWVLTVTDFAKGNADRKPGFYLDGNIHSNEIQGTEMALYTAWYLAEMSGSNRHIAELLADRVFYIVPTINPDARDDYMNKLNNMHSPRTGLLPVDNDRDGLLNEDGFEDINGDGHITLMRRKNPVGRMRPDPSDARRMVQAAADETGGYELIGFEGEDNDGDGQINEDGEGFYDPNRDWGWSWQPNYIQFGAYRYPFSIPENRNVKNFILSHPNIAGAQSFHNWGGMILRGPGAAEDEAIYSQSDVAVYDAIGKKGAELLPGYRYMVTFRDLYSVYGGEIDWLFGGRGIFCFTNELFVESMYFNQPPDGNQLGANIDQGFKFDKYLLFEDAFVPWKEFNHPQLGVVELGGFKKNFTRNDPGFLLESDAHRNMAFCLYHAYHMPKVEVDQVKEKDLGGGLREITATVSNRRIIPTHSSHDVRNKIEVPDLISIAGVKAIAGYIVTNLLTGEAREQRNDPSNLLVDNIPGNGSVTVRWIVTAKGNYTVTVDSRKGGMITFESK